MGKPNYDQLQAEERQRERQEEAERRERVAQREREIVREEFIRRERWRVNNLRERVAERKAAALLREFLSDEQRNELAQGQSFEFVSQHGRIYRISPGFYSGNVRLEKANESDQGRSVQRGERSELSEGESLCCHIPERNAPYSDNALGQMLMLQFSEDEFLGMANLA